MNPAQLQYVVEVLDDERHLNGTRYVSLEGVSAGSSDDASQAWTLALNYAQPKDSSIEEADLTLTGPDGSIFSGLVSGRTDIVTDDIGGDERELLNLRLRVDGGDGLYAGASGEVRVRGDLRGLTGEVDVALSVSGLD